MAQVSAARKAAFAILLAVERGRAHSDDLLRAPAVSRLSAADRNLATALVLGVLRWQIVLDGSLRPLLKKPNAKLDAEVLIALRLGAFQLLRMDRIPAHAAIDESVELAKQAGHRFASGMVNAVLRKLASRSMDRETARVSYQGAASAVAAESSTQILALATEASSLAAADAYPAWMFERWSQQFDVEAACAICAHGQSQPALAIRLEDPAVEAELVESGIELAPGRLLAAARIVMDGDVTATTVFREGRVRVQDEGSQFVAEIAGQGSAILDCCAAPGGKTLVLAERNPDARIVACESSETRLEALRSRLAPLGNRVECRLADATQLEYNDEFDVVLADVPCSGTGTLGRNPEIRHRVRAEELPRQAERQRLILASALHAAHRGGRLVYSTCSLETEENEQVVAAVLSEHRTARVLFIADRIEQMDREGILAPGAAIELQQCITPEGYLRLFPGAFGTDGFFVALLEKQ